MCRQKVSKRKLQKRKKTKKRAILRTYRQRLMMVRFRSDDCSLSYCISKRSLFKSFVTSLCRGRYSNFKRYSRTVLLNECSMFILRIEMYYTEHCFCQVRYEENRLLLGENEIEKKQALLLV